MNFCPYFPYLLTELTKIRYKRSAHSTAEHVRVSCKTGTGNGCDVLVAVYKLAFTSVPSNRMGFPEGRKRIGKFCARHDTAHRLQYCSNTTSNVFSTEDKLNIWTVHNIPRIKSRTFITTVTTLRLPYTEIKTLLQLGASLQIILTSHAFRARTPPPPLPSRMDIASTSVPRPSQRSRPYTELCGAFPSLPTVSHRSPPVSAQFSVPLRDDIFKSPSSSNNPIFTFSTVYASLPACSIHCSSPDYSRTCVESCSLYLKYTHTFCYKTTRHTVRNDHERRCVNKNQGFAEVWGVFTAQISYTTCTLNSVT
jgi:hypothetical protein